MAPLARFHHPRAETEEKGSHIVAPSTNPSPRPPTRLLVVNPNSSEPITENLRPITEAHAGPQLTIHLFTGPPSSPPAINDAATAAASCDACLPALLPLLPSYDAVLIACYSAHPLVPRLAAAIAAHPDWRGHKHVLGIFEASVSHALLLGRRFGIVTTGPAWVPLLERAVDEFLCGSSSGGSGDSGRFAGVRSTGLGVLELHAADAEAVAARMAQGARELVRDRGAEVVCLGCAGMSGLEAAIREGGGESVMIVDGVRAGIALLEGLVKAGYAVS